MRNKVKTIRNSIFRDSMVFSKYLLCAYTVPAPRQSAADRVIIKYIPSPRDTSCSWGPYSPMAYGLYLSYLLFRIYFSMHVFIFKWLLKHCLVTSCFFFHLTVSCEHLSLSINMHVQKILTVNKHHLQTPAFPCLSCLLSSFTS